MKRHIKTLAGVTLLEIMLVLAIASMVIVMSIRYYQSASLNQKVNSALNNITGIVAAGESYLSGAGSLVGVAAGVLPYLPNNVMPSSPWGGAMSISAAAANSYTITIPSIPAVACTQVQSLLQNNKLVMACPAGTIVVTE